MSEPVGNGPRQGIPANSFKDREQAQAAIEPREKLPQITTRPAVIKKQPWYRRAASNMIADDANTIGNYVLLDVFVPAIRNLLYDIVTQAAGRALYPGGRTGLRNGPPLGLHGNTQSIRTKYNQMAVGAGPPMIGGQQPQQLSYQQRANFDFQDIVLPDREEAVKVVNALIDRIAQYQVARVPDLFDMIGRTYNDYAALNYGWTDLSSANVTPVRDGWLLDLPRPIELRR